jgi:hypothetical protein
MLSDQSLVPLDAEIAQLFRTALIDRVTAEMVAAFNVRGIGSMLLKGPALTALLYEDEGPARPYTDSDLLVQLEDRAVAEAALAEHGFVRVDRDADWIEPAPKYARTFHRPADDARIDLHWSISGSCASPSRVWTALNQHTATLIVAGEEVTVPNRGGSALLIALHSAHHGTERPQTTIDLERAVARLSFEAWAAATVLAHQISAVPAFATGLRLLDAGHVIADRLELRHSVSTEMWLKTNPSTHGTRVIDKLSRSRSLRDALRICLLVLAPPPEVMRVFFPLARRGALGLMACYVLRPLKLLMRAPSATYGWFQARRALHRPASS